MTATVNAERQWWDEDAERTNQLAGLARQKGLTVKVSPKSTPPIKADGSLNTKGKKHARRPQAGDGAP